MTIYHRHHVVPKHAGGSNDPGNMTCPLTIEEHAEHHRYRYEMLGAWQDRLAWLSLSSQIGNDDIMKIMQHEIGTRLGRSRLGCKRPDVSARIITEETRLKMRNAKLGRKISDLTRSRMCAAQKGKKLGIVLSAETRAKMSKSHIGVKRPYLRRER